MKGKPFLVALAAFVIVVFGGVAIAGVGSLTSGDSADVSESLSGTPTALDVPEWETPTTTEAPESTTTTTKVEAATAKDEPAPAPTEKDEKAAEEAKVEETKSEDLFSIDYPADGKQVTSKVVAFGGTAADGVTVHRGKYTATPTDGAWVMELVLSPGKNKVAFEATNAEGAREVESVIVYYDARVEEEKEHDGDKGDHDKNVGFTANQKYGICGEEVPYDKFWGTAKPGATITASSPYGSASTTAGEKGYWDLKVQFPNAPVGEKFTVTITSSDGGSKSFTFVNTGGGKDH